jgi:hypothetical protein
MALNAMRKEIQTNELSSKPALPRNAGGKLSLAASLALNSSAVLVHAHPGHDLHDASMIHVVTSPDHLAVLALAGLTMLSLGYFIHRRLPRRILQCGGALAILAAAVLWGLGA